MCTVRSSRVLSYRIGYIHRARKQNSFMKDRVGRLRPGTDSFFSIGRPHSNGPANQQTTVMAPYYIYRYGRRQEKAGNFDGPAKLKASDWQLKRLRNCRLKQQRLQARKRKPREIFLHRAALCALCVLQVF